MELCTFCFTKEIAMLFTLSSLQFAVAVGRNHTVKTLGLRYALSADRAGRRLRIQRMKLQAFG
jgi:hypothetical protein